MKNIVTIGGGTGTFMMLSALKNIPGMRLSAIVSMADDGGSTGVLRDEYGVLPPGDIRRALAALSESSETMRALLNYRFGGGGLDGHNFGNILLTALEKVTGSFDSAVKEASNILNINGEVIPVTLKNVRLCAKLENGKILRSETAIDIPRGKSRARIKKVWLEPDARVNPSAGRVLNSADIILLGPGDLYTSVIPNILVKGMPEAIKKSKAKKVYIANLMTKFGETHGFRAEDFINEIEKYLGKGVLDFAVWNNRKPSGAVIERYKKEKAEFIKPPSATSMPGNIKYIVADLLDSGKFIRHNPREKLAKVIISLLS